MEKTINQQLDELFCTLESTYQEYNKAPDSFNVFDAFRIQRSELAWSAWIAYLLNPQENHGCGDIFLKLFIKLLSVPIEINTKCAKVNPEFVMELGRIDILVHDPDGKNAIIIENKIDAGDQEKQLYRYYKYAKEKFNDFRIFYLTRLKSKPSIDSIKGENKEIGKDEILQVDKDFFCISYIDDIKNWLQDCMDNCDESKPVRSIIEQSINEIDSICRQTVVDEDFRRQVEKVLNDDEKKSIEEKLKVLKDTKFEKYQKCNEQLSSLIKIYQRNLFEEMINSHFQSQKPNVYTEGKTDGYWCSKATFNEGDIDNIFVMHDWPQAMYCGVVFADSDSKLCSDSKLWAKIKDDCKMWQDTNNYQCLLYSTELDNYDGVYECLKKVLEIISSPFIL